MYLQQHKPPEQSYRRCLGLINLAKKYTPERFNVVCVHTLATNVTTLKFITNMFNKMLDKQLLLNRQIYDLSDITHVNIRVQDDSH